MNSSKTVAFSKNAVNVFFHILTQCNLKCSHCYINPDQHGREILSIDEIRAWLEVFSHKSRRANVIFLGGEPTLHPQLSDAVRHARDLGYESVTIDTNGYLFHDILDRVSPDEVDFFSFSLDGPNPRVNDAIRGRGVYEKCVSGIQKARERGFRASLIYTVSAANIHELDNMPSLLVDLGIDRFFIQVIGIRGESAQKGGLQLTRDQWQTVVPAAAQKAARLGIPAVYPKVFLDKDEIFECAGLCADNYFIFPNGRVYRCPLCEDFPLHALEFKENQLMHRPRINENDLFGLTIPEGCVMNKLIQPDNIQYGPDGSPLYRIACCMLKEAVD
jgi:MoaA/NifB/PqqE/SkfB family radical SAM enzyme